MTETYLEVPTRFGTLIAESYLDDVIPCIWISLRLENGNTVTLTAVEVNEDNSPEAELRTIVYGVEGDDEPTEVLTHTLLTQQERDELYDNRRVPQSLGDYVSQVFPPQPLLG